MVYGTVHRKPGDTYLCVLAQDKLYLINTKTLHRTPGQKSIMSDALHLVGLMSYYYQQTKQHRCYIADSVQNEEYISDMKFNWVIGQLRKACVPHSH